MIKSHRNEWGRRAVAVGGAVARAGVAAAFVFAVWSLVGTSAPGPGRAAAQTGAMGVVNSQHGVVESGVYAPNAARADGIEFALERSGETPIDTGTEFEFGPRVIYAFVDYSDVNPGDRLRWVLRHRDSGVDVNYGDIVASGSVGRAVLDLARADGDYLMLGTFELTIATLPEAGGSELGRDSFEIVDLAESDDNDNDDSGDNDNEGSDNDNDDTAEDDNDNSDQA